MTKQEIDSIIKELNIFNDFFSIYDNGVVVVHGQTTLLNVNIGIIISFSDKFPQEKPEYILSPPGSLGFIPHVMPNGYICYIRDEGVFIDDTQPESLIKQSFDKVMQTLRDGLEGRNHNDFLLEFETYWGRSNNEDEIGVIQSVLDIDDNLREVSYIHFKDFSYACIGDSQAQILDYCKSYLGPSVLERQGAFSINGLTVPSSERKVLYIPLQDNKDILPPDYSSDWSVKQLYDIINRNISKKNRELLNAEIKREFLPPQLIVLSFPVLKEAKAVIGIELYNSQLDNKEHPFIHPDKKCKVKRYVIVRHDQGYLVPRGGGQCDLTGKKVALIGCGSVGSHIAFALAKSGVLKQTLIDNDVMKPENVFRHVLGLGNIKIKNHQSSLFLNDCPKVYALKESVENALPYTEIKAVDSKVEDVINQNSLDFREYDLIIVALGNPTIESYLNRYFQKSSGMPPVLFTWLEAYGIGGHAFLTNNKDKSGCYECLIEEIEDDENSYMLPHNKSSFAEPGQYFSKSTAACYSLFTPYGSLDSQQTAILVVRLALSVLKGKEVDNPLLSWKGEADDFLANGYRFSERYNATEEKLFKGRLEYKKKDCHICGNKRGTDG